MKIKELTPCYSRLMNLVDRKKVLPVKLSYAISKNSIMLQNEVKFYIEERNKLVDTYVKKDDDGEPESKEGQYVFETSEDKKAFLLEQKNLEELEVELSEIIRKVNIQIIEEMGEKYDTLTAEDLLAIDFMLEE